MVITSGGIGGDHALVRANWPDRLGSPPADLLTGVPGHVDGRMIAIAQAAGGRLVNRDRMWHYTEGVANHDPIWPGHGIRILPGPSSLWLDALGRRLPVPLFPGFDTLGTLATSPAAVTSTPGSSPTERIVEKEFALSGSEQNPDLTGRRPRRARPGPRGVAAPVRRSSSAARTSSCGARSPTRRRDERADAVARRSTSPRSSGQVWPATARSPTRSARTCRSSRCAGPARTAVTG